MINIRLVAVGSAGLGALAVAMTAPLRAQSVSAPGPQVVTHDNLKASGQLRDGVLHLSLFAGRGRWLPEGQIAPARVIEAFGEEGGVLSIPSPLIRVPKGSVVQLTIRNTLDSTLRVHGLCDRPGPCEPVAIAPRDTRDVRFTLGADGVFHYWATSTGLPLFVRDGQDSQLGGAIVVDPVDAPIRDRVFVLGLHRSEGAEIGKELTVINGRSWPLTERFNHAVGDSVRWRFVNLTNTAHALHLHGFYFTIHRRGDGLTDGPVPSTVAPHAVTEFVGSGRTTSITWVPERAGNWLFHCHMLSHMMPMEHGHEMSARQANQPGAAGMAGLVLGVHVTGGQRATAVPDSARRRLRLIIEPDSRHGATASYKVSLAGPGDPPRVSDRAVPGPVMVLARGTPVAVEIVNRLKEPTAIHWHGIELESYDDGVADFGGSIGSITPRVPPGGTFTARFTPPRAGTFMYHTHWHEPQQLAGGIYGPLIVTEPDESFDPSTDHVVMLALDGPYRPLPDEPFAVNGYQKPPPLDLKVGVKNRIRFINITGDNVGFIVQLSNGFDPFRWTLVAKDGGSAPPASRTERPATAVGGGRRDVRFRTGANAACRIQQPLDGSPARERRTVVPVAGADSAGVNPMRANSQPITQPAAPPSDRRASRATPERGRQRSRPARGGSPSR